MNQIRQKFETVVNNLFLDENSIEGIVYVTGM